MTVDILLCAGYNHIERRFEVTDKQDSAGNFLMKAGKWQKNCIRSSITMMVDGERITRYRESQWEKQPTT